MLLSLVASLNSSLRKRKKTFSYPYYGENIIFISIGGISITTLDMIGRCTCKK
jgi:hypothetical protein